ncbi:hypothetical protein CH63R_10248 [Colletotrichum higginsianum IMI 349063]|uniref:Uncharacterized protein n=1 Tax=Colletotrichum higginsianum (strain IMI 349063) TaxID=759273 RepID=A0A1B7Y296_COLHI|nr:uncharacterized protein CH63R_10248 [Colletotrichum higginsianum IMI 349063]OBR06128.1 hypothetical protein CH63R_10248 [Colletotrichum higginsianum IMI 349063]
MACIFRRTTLAATSSLNSLLSPSTSLTNRMKTTAPRTIYRNLHHRAFPTTARYTISSIASTPQSDFPSNNNFRARPRHRQSLSKFSSIPHLQMSDADYAAFLDKANQDPNEGYAKPTGNKSNEFKAQDQGVEVPKAIQDVLKQDKVYVSDADEPFVGVALAWDEAGKGLPDEVEFAQLIEHPDAENAGVELLDPVDWDSNGDYKDIFEAVRKAGKGNDVRVYKVPKGGVRTEYWLVTTDGKGKQAKLVGVKALSIES